MKSEINFKKLLEYKAKGYTYCSSQCNDSYTGYEQTVADYYEGVGDHEPNYMDWVRGLEWPEDIEDFVTFDGIWVYGNIKSGEWEFDYSADAENESTSDEIDGMAFSIWYFNFDSMDQTIGSVDEFIKYYDKTNQEGIYSISDDWIFTLLDENLWSDANFLLLLISSKTSWNESALTSLFSFVDPKLKNNKDFVNKVTSERPGLIDLFPAALNDQREIALQSIKLRENNINAISTSLLKDHGFIIEAFEVNPSIYPHLSLEYRENLELAKKAICKDGKNYEFLTDLLKNDKELLIIASKTNRESMKFAGENLKKDKQLALALFSDKIDCFEFLDDSLRSDFEILLKALDFVDYGIYSYASDKLKLQIESDKSLIMKVVEKGVDLNDLYRESKCSDLEIIGSALKGKSSLYFEVVADSLKNNRELMLRIVKKNGKEILYLNEEFKNDKEFILAALSEWEYYYERLNPIQKKDKDIAIAVLKKNKTYAAEILSSILLKDPEIIALFNK